MIKKIIERRVSQNPASGYRKGMELYIANKVIPYQLNEEEHTKFYLARKKDLMYKQDDGLYVSLSDYSYLNKFFVDRNLFDGFSADEYRMFLKTYGVSTFVNALDLEKNKKDGMYATAIETALDYDVDIRDNDLKEYIKLVDAINRFNAKYIRRNLSNSNMNRDAIKETVVVANRNDFDDVLNCLTTDSLTSSTLSSIYSRKLFK